MKQQLASGSAAAVPSAPSGRLARISDWVDARRPWEVAGGLVLLVFLVYWPVLAGGQRLDDEFYMTPPGLRNWHGLWLIWRDVSATPQYYPLTHTVLWIENQLWGTSTTAPHLVNMLLHGAAAFLLWRLLRRLAIPGALFAAALFVIHPIHVESAAWISEQKNTLSAIFYLQAAWWYLDFDETRSPRTFGAALLAFVAGLLCKSVIATLPGAILVVCWWRSGRLSMRRDVLPSVPFWLVGIGMGTVTSWIEAHAVGAHGANFDFSAPERILIAGRAVCFYVGKLLLPVNLMLFYPRWHLDPGQWWQWLYPLAVITVLGLALWRRWWGALVAGLLFVGGLAPALGFVNVAPFIFSFVANHYAYVANMALLALLAAGFARLWGAGRSKRAPVAAAIALIWSAGLIVLARAQADLWGADPVALYRDTVERNPEAWRAEENWAMVLLAQGDSAEALPHFLVVLSKYPDLADAQLATAGLLYGQGRFAESIAHFQKTLAMTPEDPKAHFNFAAALVAAGDTAHASAEFEDAGRLGAASLEMQDRLTQVFTMIGDTARAARAGTRARELRSGMP